MKPKYDRVGVLLGGPSAEREVSLRSGAAIASGLRRAGCSVEEIDVREPCLPDLRQDLQAVFIALHGTYGEDGTVQAELEARGIPYTGPGPEASWRAFDKLATKECLAAAGLATPAFGVLEDPTACDWAPPYVVKPARQGSSIGLVRVLEESDRSLVAAATSGIEGPWLVEMYVPGRELTVGWIDGCVFPVLEIRAPGGMYDYRAKYTAGATEYLVPAPLPPAVSRACQTLAKQVSEALGGRGMGRVDLRLDAQGQPWVLELNTIPGFTETSLLPKAAAAAGIPFSELCIRILNSA